MKKIQDALQGFFLILIPILAVALVVGMLFGWIDLGAGIFFLVAFLLAKLAPPPDPDDDYL